MGEGKKGAGEADLDALRQRVRNRQLGHVIVLVAQRDKVVVDAGLVLARVVKVEALRLDVVGPQLLHLELCNLLKKPLLLRRRHAPDDDNAVVEQKHLGRVHVDVEVRHLVGHVVDQRLLRHAQVVDALVADGGQQAVAERGARGRHLEQQVPRRVAPLRVGVHLEQARLARAPRGGGGGGGGGLLRGVAVGGVDALVDQLGVGAAALPAPLEEAQQAVHLVFVCGAVCCHAGEAVAIGFPQAGGVAAGGRVLDAGVLRVDVSTALLVDVGLELGIR